MLRVVVEIWVCSFGERWLVLFRAMPNSMCSPCALIICWFVLPCFVRKYLERRWTFWNEFKCSKLKALHSFHSGKNVQMLKYRWSSWLAFCLAQVNQVQKKATQMKSVLHVVLRYFFSYPMQNCHWLEHQHACCYLFGFSSCNGLVHWFVGACFFQFISESLSSFQLSIVEKKQKIILTLSCN